jgi:hypothetical protein
MAPLLLPYDRGAANRLDPSIATAGGKPPADASRREGSMKIITGSLPICVVDEH